VKQYAETGSANQQWVLSLVSGTAYFTFRAIGNGKLLDSLGNTNQGAPVALAAENFSPSQQWASCRRFWLLSIRQSRHGKMFERRHNSNRRQRPRKRHARQRLEQHWKF